MSANPELPIFAAAPPEGPASVDGDAAQVVLDMDRLLEAWDRVARAGGAAGADGVTISEFATDAPGRLKFLSGQVRNGEYEPHPLLAVRIPKHGDPEGRELLVPAVGDRVLQRAVHDVLAPIFEPRFLPCAHGYRPGHSVRGAVGAARAALAQRPWVLDGDVQDFFPSVPHALVLAALDAWIDSHVIRDLVLAWLRTPALRSNALEARASGLPLGSPLSPLLANLVLHELDVALWSPDTTYVRYADDFLVCCPDRHQAERALAAARNALAELGLSLGEMKTRVINAADESLVFLGHLLRAQPEDSAAYETPRRRTLYISEPGCEIGHRGGRLVVERMGAEVLSVPLRTVRDIVVLGPAELTSGAISTCLRTGIDVNFLSSHGRWWGALRSWESPSPELRQLQAIQTGDAARSLAIARAFIAAKIANQRRLLQRQASRHPSESVDAALEKLEGRVQAARNAQDRLTLMGVEGAASRVFFAALAGLVPADLGFSGRARRPPTDPVNSLLSFGYTLLANEMSAACHQAGLDPFLGFLHQVRPGRRSLALDLVEELRPVIVDSLVIAVLRRKVLKGEHFHQESATGAVLLRDEPRGVFLREYELRLLTRFTYGPTGEKTSYRRGLALQAQQLARMLREPDLEYVPILLQ